MGEGNRIISHSDGFKSIPVFSRNGRGEVNDGDFILFVEFIQLFLSRDQSRDISGSFRDPVYDIFSSSSSIIFNRGLVVEEFQSGVTFNGKSSGNFFLDSGVTFG